MPPTLTYPGVYIEELPSGVHTITGVATSIAAFVGWAPQGSVTEAVLVQSWSDFAREFGGLVRGTTSGTRSTSSSGMAASKPTSCGWSPL